jgi:hypothetical protein
MKHFSFLAICVSTLVLTAGTTQLARALPPEPNSVSYMPPEGYVPNAKIAVEIAEIVAEPIYGKAALEHEQPLKARLDGDVWIVSGTLPKAPQGGTIKGGTLECRISKHTGQILRMIHGL